MNHESNKLANTRMLQFAASKLKELCNEVVFLGGCTTALFITDTAYSDVRSTLDVDCIVDVISYSQYYELGERLREYGFKQSMQESIICRWRYDDMTLDVMPTDERILGFSNRWYNEAIRHAVIYPLMDKFNIRIVTAPYFLATKFEAFKTRGENDFFVSHDFEDIVSILEGRLEISEEIRQADNEIQKYLVESFVNIYSNPSFHEALPGQFTYLADERSRIFSLKLLVLLIRTILSNEHCYINRELKIKLSDSIKKHSNLNDWQKIQIAKGIRDYKAGLYYLSDSSFNLALEPDANISKEPSNVQKIKEEVLSIDLEKMVSDYK